MSGWNQRFSLMMKEIRPKDDWILTDAPEIKQPPPGWYQYEQGHLFARFNCSYCFREWKSAQVVIVFQLQRDRHKGQVKRRVFRQRCHKCRRGYETPHFSEKTIQVVLHNLVVKIREKCYGEIKQNLIMLDPEAEEHVEGPHNQANCEACQHGVCFRNKQFGRPTSLGQSSHGPPPQGDGNEPVLACCFVILVAILVALWFFNNK